MMQKKTVRYLCLVLSVSFFLCSQTTKAKENISMKLEPFSLTEVRLLDGPCKVAQAATGSYLHALDSDRLLYTMRATAGLPTPGKPLGGWEVPDGIVRGNILGHYLSACAQMYASTGDKALKTKADNIVSELKICQQTIGTGFLFAAPPEAFSALEDIQPRIIGVPYYALHKLMAGLFDMYKLAGNQEALGILTDLTNYFVRRFDSLTATQKNNTLKAEFGGMTEVLYNLYGITDNADYARLGDFFNQDPESGIRWTSGCRPDHLKFYESLEAKIDPLDGIHANTYIPEVVGTARRYELLDIQRDRQIIEYFWNLVTKTRSYASGGSSLHEEWHEVDKLHTTLGQTNHETCGTYNMLKLTRHLFTWTGNLSYADFYERAFWNGIMGTQNPADGMTIYYLPMESGHTKNYGTPYDSFWCCTGTGMENFSQIGNSIYFHDEDGIYVNLFIASTVDWQEKGVQLEQLTRFPDEEATHLVFHTSTPVTLDLNIRVPYWADEGVDVKVNGQPVAATANPTSYVTITRQWAEGDKVDVHMPMKLHAHPMPDDPDLMAIMYGPIALAGIIEDSDFHEAPAGSDNHYLKKYLHINHDYFLADRNNLDSWMKPVKDKPLTFRTVGQPKDITFVALNRIRNERYGIYWVVAQADSSRHKLLQKQNAAIEFMRNVEAFTSSMPIEPLRKKYDQLREDPDVACYHEIIAVQMAKAEMLLGHNEKARQALASYTTPFMHRELALAIFSSMGKLFPATRPLLIASPVGDGSHQKVKRDGRFAISTDAAKSKHYIYFALPTNSPLRNTDKTVLMTITYYSNGKPNNTFVVEYDAFHDNPDAGAYTPSNIITKDSRKGWHTVTVECPRARFTGRQNFSSDFRINTLSDGDEYIADVRLNRK